MEQTLAGANQRRPAPYLRTEMGWIYIPGVPRGQGSMTLARNPTTGKEFVKYSNPTVDHRNLAISLLRDAWNGEPLDGPVEVEIVAGFARPKAHLGTGRNLGIVKASAPAWPTTPPDIDKIARLMLDACTIAGIWVDDSQVSELIVHKVFVPFGTPTGTWINVWERDELHH